MVLNFCTALYLQTVLRLTVIQKQETPKTIAIFVANLENLKDIANRSDSIGIALN